MYRETIYLDDGVRNYRGINAQEIFRAALKSGVLDSEAAHTCNNIDVLWGQYKPSGAQITIQEIL